MKYLLLMYAKEAGAPQYGTEEFRVAQEEWASFATELGASGALISNSGLSPVSTATTVRVRNGKTLTTDGPFAETHEQLGGYFLVECKDLDEALRWAAKIPTAKYGSVEVRPEWAPAQG